MSSRVAFPRVGHLQNLLRIFGYLKKHHNAELVYDPSQQSLDQAGFDAKDWMSSEFGHLQGILMNQIYFIRRFKAFLSIKQ